MAALTCGISVKASACVSTLCYVDPVCKASMRRVSSGANLLKSEMVWSRIYRDVNVRRGCKKMSTQCKLSEGDVLPPFSLRDEEKRVVSSSKFKNKPVVLYFYPADETPGCTKEACAFRDSYEKFKKAGAEVIGISADSPESHKAFAKKYRLPFTLLSDEGNKLRKEWGIAGDLFGTLPGRQTYVIDKKGVVRLVFNNQFQPEKHVDETLKVLQTM